MKARFGGLGSHGERKEADHTDRSKCSFGLLAQVYAVLSLNCKYKLVRAQSGDLRKEAKKRE